MGAGVVSAFFCDALVPATRKTSIQARARQRDPILDLPDLSARDKPNADDIGIAFGLLACDPSRSPRRMVAPDPAACKEGRSTSARQMTYG
jgi:hypothetical protein